MTGIRRKGLSVVLLVLAAIVLAAADCCAAAEEKPIPTAEAIAQMMAKEPISRATWPTWRSRHLEWLYDRTNKTKEFDEALAEFVRQEAQAHQGTLPDYLAQDAVAWSLYGGALLSEKNPASIEKNVAQAEAAFRRSIGLDAKFASPHGGLAAAIISQTFQAEKSKAAGREALLNQAEQEIEIYAKLDSRSRPAFFRGVLAMARDNPGKAEPWFRQAMDDRPESEHAAIWYARAIVGQERRSGTFAQATEPLVKRFPEEGELQVLHAVALARDNRLGDAAAALEKARKLGADPGRMIGVKTVAKIEELSRPSVVVRFLWAMAYFAAAYGAIIALMALAGVLLGLFTRGGVPPADGGFGAAHDPYARQSGLKKIYILSLTASLILFYVAVPFVVVGLLGATGAMIYGIFMLGRIPVKLVVLIAIVGIGMVWAVLKSLFAKPGTGSFGVQKAETDCPRFHAAIREVADKVETRAVDEVYLGPGSEIGVRQEGRGPFGVFGVKRRVLTVGMANLRYLTVGELKSILAHEYAHFSHRDTFYSRFIHQVTLSVDQALTGMAAAAGKLNYINPFFWFFVLYYRAYSLLAAGFSRSQEYLADRVAASLYGKDVFLSGLTKVATNGTLFEATAYQNIRQLMTEGKAFTNLYDAFASYRDEQLTDQQRREMYEGFINQQGSMFASHPTVRERMAAVASFPSALRLENAPALSLFDQPDELEKELSEYLTGYFYAVRELESAAAQSAGE